MTFLLFIFAFVLVGFFFVVSVIFTPIYFFVTGRWRIGANRFFGYWLKLSISLDQFGNGSCGKFFTVALIKRSVRVNSFPFGNIDQTVSFVLAINHKLGTLNRLGLFFVWLLEKIDKGHMKKSIYVQNEHDQLAMRRLNSTFYDHAA